MVQGRVKRAHRTGNVFEIGPKVEAGAGDETRTRDINLGKEAMAGRIQRAVAVSLVRFLQLFSNPFAIGFLWSAILFSTATLASS